MKILSKISCNIFLVAIPLILSFSLISFDSQAQLFGFDKKDKKEERKENRQNNKKENDKKEKEEDEEGEKKGAKEDTAAAGEEAFVADPRVGVPITIDMEEEEKEEEEVKEKKKRKKNVYYGLKTKKGFTKKGFGNQEVITLFHYLKEYKQPNPYIRDVYWYDTESGQIKKSYNIDKEHARILHGPYERVLGDQVIERGIFYIGTKHGRWTEYNKNDILMDKEKYIKGWPKESMISYYGREGDKVKEVIPVEYGKREGFYYYFFENGQVAVTGEYQYGEKVGVWREYYKDIKKRKKEIQYREDPFNDNFIPYVLKAWDRKGNLVYESRKVPES